MTGQDPIQSGDDVAARDALHWLIALQEDPDNGDLRSRFQRWLQADPRHEAAWTELGVLSNLIVEGERAAKPLPRTRPFGARPNNRRNVFKFVGVAACLAVGTALLLPSLLLQLRADYVTQAGEVREILLPDNSKVSLGARSAIKLSFTPDRRRLELLDGQAYFDVTPDKARPFTVVFGDAEVTVLGTAFEISRQAEAEQVSVDHGSVQVNLTGNSASLAKLANGDAVQIDRSKSFQNFSLKPDEIASWRNGKLIVKNRPLPEVIAELRRYQPGAIVFGGLNAQSFRVTGVFDLRDPAEALRAAASAHGLKVRQLGPWLLTVSAL